VLSPAPTAELGGAFAAGNEQQELEISHETNNDGRTDHAAAAYRITKQSADDIIAAGASPGPNAFATQGRIIMSFRLAAGAAVVAAVIAPGVSGAQVLMERNVSAKMALTIAETALAECGSRVSVAVVDRAGRLRVFVQGDGAAPHNLELARRKAYTARTFGRTSLEWAQRTETQVPGQRQLAEVIPLQGGVPIKVGDDTIGGVGLSGAPNGGPQEEACGKAGIAKVADELK
jgi:uncharacterized protein GlcG (DUF336 family)